MKILFGNEFSPTLYKIHQTSYSKLENEKIEILFNNNSMIF